MLKTQSISEILFLDLSFISNPLALVLEKDPCLLHSHIVVVLSMASHHVAASRHNAADGLWVSTFS